MATEVAAAGVRRLHDRCCVLSDLLRRNLEVVVREARDVLALEEDYNRLQADYVERLARVGRDICRLLAGGAPQLDAASDVLGAWLRAEDATRADMRRIRLYSRAARGIPVSMLAKTAEQTAVRVSAVLPETKPHKRCKKKVAVLHEQVRALCPRLKQSARTLQRLLYLTRALPLLKEFQERLGAFSEPEQQEEPPPEAESADEEERREPSALYCGGPLWTRLTAEVCHHRCLPDRLARLLDSVPRNLGLSLDPGAGPDLQLGLDLQLELELDPHLEGATKALLEGRATKRKASPTRNMLIGILEDEDGLQPIKIPQLDPSLFKPLPE